MDSTSPAHHDANGDPNTYEWDWGEAMREHSRRESAITPERFDATVLLMRALFERTFGFNMAKAATRRTTACVQTFDASGVGYKTCQ